MKQLLLICGLFIFIKIQPSDTLDIINGNVFNFDTENKSETKNTFQNAYSVDCLFIGSLKSKTVAAMIPHLKKVASNLKIYSIGSICTYLLQLCNDYSSLRKLNEITKNIFSFVSATGGGKDPPEKNTIFQTMRRTKGNENVFSATSILTNNKDEIKKYFDELEEKTKRALTAAKKQTVKALSRARNQQKRAQAMASRTTKAASTLQKEIQAQVAASLARTLGQIAPMSVTYSKKEIEDDSMEEAENSDISSEEDESDESSEEDESDESSEEDESDESSEEDESDEWY